MTSEMLSKILKIEEEAAVAELAAKTKAEELIKEAKLKAQAVLLSAQQQAEKNTDAVISQTKQRAAEINKTATGAAKAEGSVIIADAGARQPEAVKVLKDYLLPNSGI